MNVTYYGQSCIAFDFEGTKVLIDPFIRHNPLAKAIDVSTLNPDYIFLTHAHFDHVADMKEIQQQSGATVAAVVETAAWVRKQGVAEDKVMEFNFGGTLNLPFGKVKMVYALHTNSTPEGDYAGVPVGYVFTVGDKRIYVAGDTALTMEMKLLADMELDWAILPIGGHYTMDMDDAIKAAQFVECKHVIGVHYNTFPPIAIDTNEAIEKFASKGLTLHLPAVGQGLAL